MITLKSLMRSLEFKSLQQILKKDYVKRQEFNI
jgi:hypothetical protein